MPNSAVTSAAGQPPKPRRTKERQTSPRQAPTRGASSSEVQVSAVISTYLLTHLHHVLQRAEFTALQEGRQPLAANYAQLRQQLCLEARSLERAPSGGEPGESVEPPQAA
ncbi:hypothetical protein FQK07_11280 [Synechococcus sp. BSF8S]|uniref:hypothetical protein n=1 Tax=Synechococcales TaxID=1890424 RepID=UPI001624AA1B|nr:MULTISPECIES: hypothetical protein [unclassified Synechococcus]MBC1261833.1 hypothetical protein [Synechococcus sp. BSF8S]MBC1264761.1 hypothetical protein [Synechococcus sp. BSA11S]